MVNGKVTLTDLYSDLSRTPWPGRESRESKHGSTAVDDTMMCWQDGQRRRRGGTPYQPTRQVSDGTHTPPLLTFCRCRESSMI